MKIRYSLHAQRKMVERNISGEWVENVLRAGSRLPDIKNRQRAVAIVDICCSPAERHTSRELSPGVIADLNKADSIIALEILNASTRYPTEELAKFSFERTPT